MKRGFTLVELLVAVAVFALLLGTTLAVLLSSSRVEGKARAVGALSGRASLVATVLLRDLYPVGYGLSSGVALRVNVGAMGEDEVVARYLCEGGMEERCPVGGVWTTAYKGEGGSLLWGGCQGGGCSPAYEEMEGGVEVFRVALFSGGAWARRSVTVDLSTGNSGVQALAFYLRLKGERRTGGEFAPGESVNFPQGLSLETFGLRSGRLADGFPRAERLVVVWTPNLER